MVFPIFSLLSHICLLPYPRILRSNADHRQFIPVQPVALCRTSPRSRPTQPFRWVFFGDEKTSEPYAEDLTYCRGCGRSLERKGLRATTPSLLPYANVRHLLVSAHPSVRRIGTQPQRDVGGLHRLPYNPYQIVAQ